MFCLFHLAKEDHAGGVVALGGIAFEFDVEGGAGFKLVKGEAVGDGLLAGLYGLVGLHFGHQFLALPEFHSTQADGVIATGGDNSEFIGTVAGNLARYLKAPVGRLGLYTQGFPTEHVLSIGLVGRIVGGEVEVCRKL